MARVCNYLLGGHDNFAADRELAGRLTEICPGLRGVLEGNRAFITRAVAWAASQGIRQFADLGTGLPAHPSAVWAARAVVPSVRLVNVDIRVSTRPKMRHTGSAMSMSPRQPAGRPARS